MKLLEGDMTRRVPEVAGQQPSAGHPNDAPGRCLGLTISRWVPVLCIALGGESSSPHFADWDTCPGSGPGLTPDVPSSLPSLALL